jgi:hypothetical protein
MDKLVAGLAGARTMTWYKTTSTTAVAGDRLSYFYLGGVPTLPSAIPSSVAVVCNSGTLGSPLGMTGSTGEAYVASAWIVGGNITSFTLYDRLMHCGGLSAQTTVSQAIAVTSTGAFDTARTSSQSYNDFFIEWYTTTGISTGSWTFGLTYTDGSTGSYVYPYASTRRQSQLQLIYSSATSLLIQSVDTVAITTVTGTAGSFGVTCARRLCDIPAPVVLTGYSYDFASIGMPRILGTSFLWLTGIINGTASSNTQFSCKVIST